MKFKAFVGIVLVLMFIGMLTLTFNIQPVKASGTIYIRADGSVDPSTANITSTDNVTYTFTDNIYDKIVVERDSIVVDGAGYTLQGTGSGTGIDLIRRSNVTIRNIEIDAFYHGIYLRLSSNNTISGNNITNNEFGIRLYSSSNNNVFGNNITNNYHGIWLDSSSNNIISGNNITENNGDGIWLGGSNNTVSGNNITNNGYGIWLGGSNNTVSGNNITENNWSSIYLQDSSNHNTIFGNNITENNGYGIWLGGSNNTVSGNTITNNGYGIWLYYSSNNTLRNNDASNNKYNFGVYGYYVQDIDDSNTVNGKPIYYWINRQDMTMPLDAGYVALINCTRIAVKSLNLTNNEQGVLLAFTTNSTITKNNMTNNKDGIRLSWSSNNVISGNNITQNNECGIRLDSSSVNVISGNTVTNNEDGMRLSDSSNNVVFGNNITENNGDGIWLSGSSNNTLRNNDASNNKCNFGVYGWLLSHHIQDIDDSNTVNGKPIYYWINRQDMAVPLDAGYVALINCTSITVKNLNLANNGQGVLLISTTNSTITKNNITNNGDGIYLRDSSNNTVSGNNITNNGDGIYLRDSSNNTVSGNNITNNWSGIYLWESSNNTVSGNNITNNGYGIQLDLRSNYNAVSGNNITENSRYGILLAICSDNIIYHNNFVDNTEQVYTDGSINLWDDGYPSGGNYWSDYAGVDFFSGPHQNENGSDGIGDTAYTIYWTLQDRYPLMNPRKPEYTFTTYSSPTGVTFTIDDVSHTTPWSETYDHGTLISPVMPQTHTVGEARYYWDKWSDGVTNRSRTVIINRDITLTGLFTGPYYELTVISSPITGITFTINESPQTTPYTDWLLEGSYILQMPETYNGYVWSHWLEDGDTNRIKTITLPETTYTAVYILPPIGGTTVAIQSKPSSSWITPILLILTIAVASSIHRKHKKPSHK